MNKRQGYIYCYTNIINGKQYIGSTVAEPNVRYNQHKYNATHPNTPKYNYPLYQAFRKYGLKNFSYEVIETLHCTEIELRERERKYIIEYECLTPFGYNQTLNTEHPLMDEKAIYKVSETKRNSAKRVAEIANDLKIINIWRSIADCAEEQGLSAKNIAACCRGEQLTVSNRVFYWLDDNNNLIIPNHSTKVQYKGMEGTTQIQSTSKKVAKIDDNNVIVAIYDTIALAARENQCDSSGISKVCRKIRNKCGGYKWQYVE